MTCAILADVHANPEALEACARTPASEGPSGWRSPAGEAIAWPRARLDERRRAFLAGLPRVVGEGGPFVSRAGAPRPRARAGAVHSRRGAARAAPPAASHAMLDAGAATPTSQRAPCAWRRAAAKVRAAGFLEALARRLRRGG